MNAKVLGIDIAKNTFQLHGVDGLGKLVLKKRLSRNQLAAYVANLSECLIVMESCGGANYWARVFQKSGHTVGRWLTGKRACLSFNKAAVALANKNARIIWSLLNTGEEFNCNVQIAAT